MKLQELHDLWEKEQRLDFSQPDKIIRDIPIAHSRWWRIYTDECESKIALQNKYDQLYHLKYEWYIGRMDDAERIKLGWEQQPLRLLKAEVEKFLLVDPDLTPLRSRLELAEKKEKFLLDCVKSIGNRGFLVKSYMEWLQYSQGA